jgi:hypothetical protein
MCAWSSGRGGSLGLLSSTRRGPPIESGRWLAVNLRNSSFITGRDDEAFQFSPMDDERLA